MDDTGRDPSYRMVFGVRARPGLTGRMVLGLVIMSLGVLWTLDNLGLVESEPILRWWPTVLVAIGLGQLTGWTGCRRPVSGALFVIFGGWMLAHNLDLVQTSVWELWPLALVAIGVGMLVRSSSRFSGPGGREGSGGREDVSSRLSAFAFMSGVDRKVASPEWTGGDATAVMGGVKLDLRGARPAPQGAVLDVTVCWGGIELYVPDHWRVVNEATVLMGGLEDRTKTPPPDTKDTLIVRGLVCMGGIEVRN